MPAGHHVSQVAGGMVDDKMDRQIVGYPCIAHRYLEREIGKRLYPLRAEMDNTPGAALDHKIALQQFLIAVDRVESNGVIGPVIVRLYLFQVIGVVSCSGEPERHEETFGICRFAVYVDIQHVEGNHVDLFLAG